MNEAMMSERRPVTLADVAKVAGVAKSTASYAFADPSRLSPATTQRVLDAAHDLGYSGPSALGRALASGRTSVVAVVTRAPLESPDTDPFALRVVDGIEETDAMLAQRGVPWVRLDGTPDDTHPAFLEGPAAKDLGLRVPEDVSITGFDGLTEGVFAELDLTSVVQDGTEKGRLIARWVTLACEGPDVPSPFDLPLSIRWGSTAGPAPQS